MATHDPLQRERLAHREIGHTAVSAALAGAVVAAFLLVTAAVPALELTRSGSLESWLGLASDGREAMAAAASGRGLPAVDRGLLEAMSSFEDRLEEESVVGVVARPWAQWVQTAWLGVGNDRALVGEDGWLFFRPAVGSVTGPGFLDPAQLVRRSREGPSWQPPVAADPLPALIALDRDLAARGIELVVLPVPVKVSIHPERFTSSAAPVGDSGGLHNPSWPAFLERLAAAGVEVVDPAPELAKAAAGSDQFLARDTHWSPAAVERTARLVADRIAARGLLPPAEPLLGPAGYRARPAEVEGTGDLVRILDLPAAPSLFEPQAVTVRRIERVDGRPWVAETAAEVLLLGDSFTNVYSQPDVGWGEGAGLAEQLAFVWQRPIDRIAVNAGGAEASRRRLYDLLAADAPRIRAKQLVIYELSARELAIGDWRLFSAAPGDVALPADAAPSQSAVASPAGPVAPGAESPDDLAARRRPPEPASPLGDGFAVWESNRTGDWRLWTRRLDGTGLRQLTAEEPEMQHCCPHISPDGRRLVYLARAGGRDEYLEKEIAGELRLIDLETAAGGSGEPVRGPTLVAARTYGWGNRSAVWRDDERLVYVDAEGRTAALALGPGASGSGQSTLLTREPRAELGWLVDSTLRWATNAAPTFSLYDAEAQRVIPRGELGGCEPYFTHDGRWGYYIAAGGGPINRIDLATRETSTLVRKYDPRLPSREGYLYFPMVSRDGSLLAWGASAGDHDHFRSDYNIWVAPLDPETLELAGTPTRLTEHPKTDRYPDVHLRPLPLGRHAGEAPLTVTFPPVAEVERWDYGDGEGAAGAGGRRHRYEEPGVYEVVARGAGGPLRGRVTVRVARPPEVMELEVRAGERELVVSFDEPIQLLDGATFTLRSGSGGLGSPRLSDDGRRLVLPLAGELEAADRLRLFGVADRAELPNRMPAVEIEVPEPAWPATREGLVFLWQTADRPNQVFDPELREDVVDALVPHGRARLDGQQRMMLAGGWFSAPAAASERILEAASRANEVTLEATISPGEARGDLGRIVTYSPGPARRNLTLGQRGDRLVARVRTGPTGANADRPEVPLFAVEAGKAYHVVVTYSPGLLVAYRNGEKVLESRDVVGGLNRWEPFPLAFGAEPGGAGDWAGTLEGVALYARVLAADEVEESFLRYRKVFTSRPAPAERIEVRGTLTAVSRVPSLREISPYRRALAVFEYRVDEVLAGAGSGVSAGDRLRVAHWVLLDGDRTPAAGFRPGGSHRLRLEPFAANPQLTAHYLSDTLEAGPSAGAGLYFSLAD